MASQNSSTTARPSSEIVAVSGDDASPSRDDLDRVFSYHFWRQRIPLTASVGTPGRVFASEWEEVFLPDRLTGLSFLDVGANDGLFSFLAERHGASRVVATDIYTTENVSHMTAGWNSTGAMIARDFLRSNVEFRNCNIFELDTLDRRFDYVFCSHVVAWLTDPLTAIEQLAARCAGTLHLREDVSRVDNPRPVLELVKDFTAREATCYYNPNKAWLTAVLRGLGFRDISFKPIDEGAILQHRFEQFPLYSIPARTKVYKTPFETSVHGHIETAQHMRSEYQHDSFLFFPATGWINASDVVFVPDKPRPAPSLLRRAKSLLKRKSNGFQHNQAIIARR